MESPDELQWREAEQHLLAKLSNPDLLLAGDECTETWPHRGDSDAAFSN